ncbi:hypothetical protein ACVWWO_000461 [Bradyrhizobium sp. F1.13.1]
MNIGSVHVSNDLEAKLAFCPYRTSDAALDSVGKDSSIIRSTLHPGTKFSFHVSATPVPCGNPSFMRQLVWQKRSNAALPTTAEPSPPLAMITRKKHRHGGPVMRAHSRFKK